MSLFTPRLILDDITCVSEQLLKDNNIKALILDVDNTLTEHGSQELSIKVENWLAKMRLTDIKLMIVSNNTKSRVEPFARKLNLPFVSMSLKPSTRGLSKAINLFGVGKKEVAIVGDQIYTDIVGGNLIGMFTILVTPILFEDKFFFKFKRRLEKIHIKHYDKINK